MYFFAYVIIISYYNDPSVWWLDEGANNPTP